MSKQKNDRRDFLKAVGTGVFALSVLATTGSSVFAAQTPAAPDMSNGADNFYTSAQVTVEKVRFKNQYQMNVPAISICRRTSAALAPIRRLSSGTRWGR